MRARFIGAEVNARDGLVSRKFAATGASAYDVRALWGAKALFAPRDHPDLQVEPSADAPHG